MRKYISVPMGWVMLVVFGILASISSSYGASTKRKLGPNAPNPTATPQLDKTLYGIPKPSAIPSCGDGTVGLYSDPDGHCIYACADGLVAVIAGVACVHPTTSATPTPTVTATRTPTPTPTST